MKPEKLRDLLTENEIKNSLTEKELFKIALFDEVCSTNLIVKNAALSGEKEGFIAIADSQTAGRGRFCRKFYSPKQSGIYMSLLLRPTINPQEAVLITAAAAVAVSEAVETLSGKETKIKWVNDVFTNSKKVCGILTEGGINPENGRFEWAVLGIGINAYTPENGFEEEIKTVAGAVFDTKKEGLRSHLAAEIINNFWKYYKDIGKKSFLETYRSSSLVIGKAITVHKGEKALSAKALGIDDSCRLLVEYENGKKEFLSSGEISIKIKA